MDLTLLNCEIKLKIDNLNFLINRKFSEIFGKHDIILSIFPFYKDFNIELHSFLSNMLRFSILVWSLGITAIELADGRPPYSDIHPMRAMFMIPTKEPATVQHPEMFSEAFNQFVARCLVKDPGTRESSSDLLQRDAFIRGAKSGSILSDIIELAIRERKKIQPSDLVVEGDFLKF